MCLNMQEWEKDFSQNISRYLHSKALFRVELNLQKQLKEVPEEQTAGWLHSVL